MAECFEKIGEELAELFIERMSWAVWIYSDLFGECWYCFGILDSKLVCEVGKTSWELDACVSSFEKKKLASNIFLFSFISSTIVRAIVVFPIPAIPFNQNTHSPSSLFIHVLIFSSTLVRVPLKHGDMSSTRLDLCVACMTRGSFLMRSFHDTCVSNLHYWKMRNIPLYCAGKEQVIRKTNIQSLDANKMRTLLLPISRRISVDSLNWMGNSHLQCALDL